MTDELSLELVNTVKPASYTIMAYPALKLPPQFIPLIFSKWLRSLRYGNPLFKIMSPKEYYKNYHTYIENLMKKPDAIIRLAVLSDDHDVVLGFSMNREDVLDYLHVHTDYRKIGIGRALMPVGITTFTHVTSSWLSIWPANQNYKDLKFDPFA